MSVAYSSLKIGKTNKTNTGTSSVSNDIVNDVVTNDPIINIHVAAKNLAKLDLGSESDPMCVMFIQQNGRWLEVDRTEVVWDNPNPSWVRDFKAMYIFETHQPLRFCIYDCDSEKGPLENHDYVGYCDTTVQQLVSSIPQDLSLPIKNEKLSGPRGNLILTTEQATSSSSVVSFDLSVQDLKRMRTFSRNNPYIIISKPSESGRELPVFRSEVVPKCSTCTYKKFSIPMNSLCNGDIQTPIVISVFDFREGKTDVFVGKMSATVQTLMENQGNKYPIKDPKNKDFGFIRINQIGIVQKPTFCDYLRSGIQLNLITAVDFTASNRDPSDPRSLHFLNPNSPNQYESCIWSIGTVVCPYDSDQHFPVFGFGGKINGMLSHCFPLTFDQASPNVQGLEGIVTAYRNSLRMVQLSGPTCFAPVIKAASQVAITSFAESHTYTILMILTDGVINDMVETIDAIVDATSAPISIIIIGVGSADFSMMDQLDADQNPLRSSHGMSMKRDIVQFVPFNQFLQTSGPSLAAEVLAEVPKQVDEYCRSVGFVPMMN